jgi:hypothetical protein
MIIDIERKYRFLKVYYVPATSGAFLAFSSLFFFATATNSTNDTYKGRQYVLLISLSFLDVYGYDSKKFWDSFSVSHFKTVAVRAWSV